MQCKRILIGDNKHCAFTGGCIVALVGIWGLFFDVGGGIVLSCVLWEAQDILGLHLGVSVKYPHLGIMTQHVSRHFTKHSSVWLVRVPLGEKDDPTASHPWAYFHFATFQQDPTNP